MSASRARSRSRGAAECPRQLSRRAGLRRRLKASTRTSLCTRRIATKLRRVRAMSSACNHAESFFCLVLPLLSLGGVVGCGVKGSGDESASTETTTSVEEASSSAGSTAATTGESGSGGTTGSDQPWPDVCDGLDEVTCGPKNGQYQCAWVDVLHLTIAATSD